MRPVPKKGDRVRTPHGDATVIDDYWRHRDRFTVSMDSDGKHLDYGTESLTVRPVDKC